MNKPLIFIMNGSGGCGKDTFVDLCREYSVYCVRHCSTIEPIKAAAKMLGWNGQKDEKSRKFLSDLKDLCTITYNTSFNYIAEEIENASDDDIEYIFIDCREPEEIYKIVHSFENVKTIYVDASARIPHITSNHADANTAQYPYDYYINNNGTLDDLKKLTKEFIQMWDKEIENEAFD